MFGTFKVVGLLCLSHGILVAMSLYDFGIYGIYNKQHRQNAYYRYKNNTIQKPTHTLINLNCY